jgi:imidazole glycerol-phosphate synthase subunit HisH
MIGIMNYGVGNVGSIARRLQELNIDNRLVSDLNDFQGCGGLILPGVGSFDYAMKKLASSGLIKLLKQLTEEGIPLLGICVGHQMLFQSSDEGEGMTPGLGLLEGTVVKIENNNAILPHMGWNNFQTLGNSKLLDGIVLTDEMYYLHSYQVMGCDKNVVATTSYHGVINAVIEKGNILGVQAHPEKSHLTGTQLFKNFYNHYVAK